MMALLGAISVRTLDVGGPVARTVSLIDMDARALLGRRHIVFFIHGYNVNRDAALKSYNLLFTRKLVADIVHVLWPGDARGGFLVSGGSYPFQLQSARDSAARLTQWLSGLYGPGGGPVSVSIIAHSLGCRLTLEILRTVVTAPGSFPEFVVVALMAAAVPVALVDGGGELEPAALSPRKLALLYSYADWVLRFAFPAGQTAARLGFQDSGGPLAGGDYNRAVGTQGEPLRLRAYRSDFTAYKYGHGSYWGGQEAFDFVSPFFGVAAPRVTPSRGINVRATPSSASLADTPPPAPLARSLPTRRLSR